MSLAAKQTKTDKSTLCCRRCATHTHLQHLVDGVCAGGCAHFLLLGRLLNLLQRRLHIRGLCHGSGCATNRCWAWLTSAAGAGAQQGSCDGCQAKQHTPSRGAVLPSGGGGAGPPPWRCAAVLGRSPCAAGNLL